jgi:hypothetical protein
MACLSLKQCWCVSLAAKFNILVKLNRNPGLQEDERAYPVNSKSPAQPAQPIQWAPGPYGTQQPGYGPSQAPAYGGYQGQEPARPIYGNQPVGGISNSLYPSWGSAQQLAATTVTAYETKTVIDVSTVTETVSKVSTIIVNGGKNGGRNNNNNNNNNNGGGGGGGKTVTTTKVRTITEVLISYPAVTSMANPITSYITGVPVTSTIYGAPITSYSTIIAPAGTSAITPVAATSWLPAPAVTSYLTSIVRPPPLTITSISYTPYLAAEGPQTIYQTGKALNKLYLKVR